MTKSEWIFQVVTAFYEQAKNDILIGYHFRNIHDFELHIPRIAAFWEIQLLGSTEKKFGEPFDVMKAHIPLEMKRGELGRWLLLFRKTLDQTKKSHPEMIQLQKEWEKKLVFFEEVFSRFFGL
jgi:truncated hemoglobin YjbI